MNIGRDEVVKACRAGLGLLGPESEVLVPAKFSEGLCHLKSLLSAIHSGQIALAPTMQKVEDELPSD